MFKWIKTLYSTLKNKGDDPGLKGAQKYSFYDKSKNPPLPTKYVSTPWGHWNIEFLVWAFGEVPNFKPSCIYVEAWNKKYANLYLIPINEDLATHLPKMEMVYLTQIRSPKH